MKKSTGALSRQRVKEQERMYDSYSKNSVYDYVFIGTGNAALTTAALLARAGKSVCMLEAHDTPGGYAHTFRMGAFSFCAQVHYIWGCASGDLIYEFLRKIGLHKDITFNLYDPRGYDRMVLPDGTQIKIPYGFNNLTKNIVDAYPNQEQPVRQFLETLSVIRSEFNYLPMKYQDWLVYIMTHPYRFRTIIRYIHKTLQNVFDECQLSKEVQACFAANAGNFMSPPNELSVFAYVGLFYGYNTGAFYPRKHYKYYIQRIADFISRHPNCHIYLEQEVVKFVKKGKCIDAVQTADGKTFKGKQFICNMDPQKAAHMIGWKDVVPKYRKGLTYRYSPTGLMIYLGLKGLDPRKYGFGTYNTWHLEQWDVNKIWKDVKRGRHDKPWIFMSTPTLHSRFPGIAPKGCHILEIATLVMYNDFAAAKKKSYSTYLKKKLNLANYVIGLVEKHYIPNLSKYIVTKVIGSPTTNEDFVHAPFGNSYGALLTPKNMGADRPTGISPWKNLYWCNATAGYGGMYGTTWTGVRLYMNLTHDWFYDPTKTPTEEELIKRAKQGHM